jgi:phosphonate transport system substrate-binding protein
MAFYLKAFLLLLLFCSQTAYAEISYTWSVVPQFTGTTIHRDWMPLLKRLEAVTAYHFKLKIYDSIPQFEKSFLKGEIDFAYMNPYHAVMAMEAQGYQPIIRNGKQMLTGILVTRKDSHIDNVQALNGKKIAFPSPNAFAAALYMRALLREKEGIDFTAVYAGTHSNAYRQTLIGRTAASGAVKRTLLKQRTEVQQALKIIYTTPGNPSHPIAVHPRVPHKVKVAVQQAILKMAQSDDDRSLLKSTLLSAPVKADYERDYLPLKLLKLDKYVDRQ